MAKGDFTKNEFRSFKDKYTGKEITQLTSSNYLSHHGYFYNKMQTNDLKHLIYASNRDGDRNLYKMNLESGEVLQLTEGKGIGDFGYKLTADDKYLIFCRDNRIIRLCMNSLSEEVIYEASSEWELYKNPGISSDSRYLANVEIKRSDITPHNKNNMLSRKQQWEKNPAAELF